jgi:hypothetical protein
MINRIEPTLSQGRVTCIVRMDENNVVSVRLGTTQLAARQEYETALSAGILVAKYRNVPAFVARRIFEEHNDEHLANCSTRKEAVTWVRAQVKYLILEERLDL